MVLTTMAKPGRNDPCPCGSGNKYKKCCLPKQQVAALEEHAKSQAGRDERAAARRLRDQQIRAEMAAKWAGDWPGDEDQLTTASNAVVDLVHAGKLDEAEAAARLLLVHYPDLHDGWDRLGLVHEARGENRQAADCYRKVIEFLEQNPDYADPGFVDVFANRIVKLDPPSAN
jgi:tetratricopeptide (TPR) repeat protein